MLVLEVVLDHCWPHCDISAVVAGQAPNVGAVQSTASAAQDFAAATSSTAPAQSAAPQPSIVAQPARIAAQPKVQALALPPQIPPSCCLLVPFNLEAGLRLHALVLLLDCCAPASCATICLRFHGNWPSVDLLVPSGLEACQLAGPCVSLVRIGQPL